MSVVCIDDENGDSSFTICISSENTVYSFGRSNVYSHGHENTTVFPPKQIPNLTNIKMIDCGLYHTICIDYEGTVFSFGKNNDGQLGISNNDKNFKTHIPQIVDVPPIKFVSCGFEFTICITFDGNLYSFGNNFYGQLGIGTNEICYSSPQIIQSINDVDIISCGGYHVICKTYSNEYFSWGHNKHGQLGQGNNDSCKIPITCLNWPEDIISIKTGNNHSLLLNSLGNVYSFGINQDIFGNNHGQLGLQNVESINIPTLVKELPHIERIECGCRHSMCIDINDKLWVFGNNHFGQLGLGDYENRNIPVLNIYFHNIIDISSRGNHVFVKNKINEIFAFGRASSSQLGFSSPSYQQAVSKQTLIKKEDIWGSKVFHSTQKSARN